MKIKLTNCSWADKIVRVRLMRLVFSYAADHHNSRALVVVYFYLGKRFVIGLRVDTLQRPSRPPLTLIAES